MRWSKLALIAGLALTWQKTHPKPPIFVRCSGCSAVVFATAIVVYSVAWMQYAKGAGFETIAVSHSPDKDKMIRDLGSDEVGATARALRQLGAQM